MPNESVERAVDDLIAKGRISRDMRNEYIQHFEQNLQNDLLRGADYTNKTKQLAEERRQAEAVLQQEKQRIAAERQRLEQWQNQVGTQLQDYDKVMKEVIPSLTAKATAYEQALRDYQILDKVEVPSSIPSITDRREAPRTMPERPSTPTDVPYLTRDAAAGALRDFAVLNGKMAHIQAQHLKLYGEPLDDDLITHFFETGEDPVKHWEVKYNVQAKRQQLADTERNAEIARMREEIRAEIMRDVTLDPGRIVGSPSQGVKGGLSPMLEQYTQSRALAHSQNHANDKAAAPGPDEFVPPEKRPDIQSARDRVARASRMFADNFDALGRPTTEHGRDLSRRYSTD